MKFIIQKFSQVIKRVWDLVQQTVRKVIFVSPFELG
jgi:hypothetical protein